MKSLSYLILAPVAIALLWAPLGAQSPVTVTTPAPADEVELIAESVEDLQELVSAPDDAIPLALLRRAEGIVVIPTLVKGGFIVGAKHGDGILSARVPGTREWSLPVFVTMTGGSIGWQIGVESVDLAFLIMNKEGVDSLLDNKFTIGGNASVAAGPVGRSASAATDARLNSQILAYSRTKGFFAGATLEGAALRPNDDANRDFYGEVVDSATVINTARVDPGMPAAIVEWHRLLASFENVDYQR